mmetsp:Transcript_56161/g.93596  ORF Transcript_56161/g.93596 Transcript_56161/m.93596 type:complete len:239 (+) Transcript_56161:336-1052(+)
MLAIIHHTMSSGLQLVAGEVAQYSTYVHMHKVIAIDVVCILHWQLLPSLLLLVERLQASLKSDHQRNKARVGMVRRRRHTQITTITTIIRRVRIRRASFVQWMRRRMHKTKRGQRMWQKHRLKIFNRTLRGITIQRKRNQSHHFSGGLQQHIIVFLKYATKISNFRIRRLLVQRKIWETLPRQMVSRSTIFNGLFHARLARNDWIISAVTVWIGRVPLTFSVLQLVANILLKESLTHR